MKSGARALICLFGCAALTTGVRAVVNDSGDGNPYGAIVERNVFDLKPPIPVSVTNNEPPPKPPSNVKLTGITSILGNKRALFLVTQPATPGQPPPKEESVILAEGQREGDLEVLEITDKADPPTVKIKNDGEVSVVTFEKIKPAGGPGAPGAAAPAPFSRPPVFAPPPTQPLAAAANNGIPSMPTRDVRTDSGQQGGLPGSQQNGSQGGLQGGTGFQPQQAAPPAISPEEQMIMMEAERERTKDMVAAGAYPPLPPTPLTGMLQQGNNEPPAPPGPPSPAAPAPPPLGSHGNYIPPGLNLPPAP